MLDRAQCHTPLIKGGLNWRPYFGGNLCSPTGPTPRTHAEYVCDAERVTVFSIVVILLQPKNTGG